MCQTCNDPKCPKQAKLAAAEGLLDAAKVAVRWMTAIQLGRVGLRVAIENYEGVYDVS